jgi:hypothetical protein
MKKNTKQQWVKDNPITFSVVVGGIGFMLPFVVAFPIYMLVTLASV